MEEKLQSYRLRKRRTETVQSIKEKFAKVMSFVATSTTSVANIEKPTHINIENSSIEPSDVASVTSSDFDLNDDKLPLKSETSPSSHSWITYCTWLVYFLVWVTLFAIALELQFGAVFFMLSCFLGICLNLRDKSKSSNEISAYSVFNKNCESIDGTFKAEMFEQQLGVRKL